VPEPPREASRRRRLEALVLLGDRVALLAVGARELRQQFGESAQAVARGLGKIRAAEKGLLLRREKHRQRPAATPPRQQRVRRLVYLIEVGPFFPIDLDVDEKLVHMRGHGLVLERLVRHHMAPVARRVADR
jgi:hypothetical protein